MFNLKTVVLHVHWHFDCNVIFCFVCRALARYGGLPKLHHLDLSGCLQVTAQGLMDLVHVCPNLDHTEFFYCDNIDEGPYPDTASGCQNLQCKNRVCCRSGEWALPLSNCNSVTSVSFLQIGKHQQGVLNSDETAVCFNNFILWRFSFLMNFFVLTSGILLLD